MALIGFRVENQKAIRLAAAPSVPPVMVIAGPNGVGKSTLLYAIKNGSGQFSANTRILYQGPHRVLRRTQVQRKWLGGNSIRWLFDLMSGGGDVSGYEGLNFQNSNRTPDNVDEAGGTIKHTLGKIENRRQTLLAELIDRRKAEHVNLDVSALPNVYEPLSELTQYLLPHLRFNRVDFKNEDNIRCVWSRTDAAAAVELDIDDLSSGEKSIVILFLPLLESKIRTQIHVLENLIGGQPAQAAAAEEHVILIDEPEQHLHPDLQTKILSYIRALARDQKTQFVITTHSPTILDQAFDDELFVLSNPSDIPTENQLRRIASDAERLEALKQLAGSTYFLTTGRAIVCIEGEREIDTDEPTDLRLLEVMYPRATAVTLVPTTGKGNVITTVTRLREHVPEDVFRIRVRGLVDSDQGTEQIPGIEELPVCMIENFLLDADALFTYCQSIQVDGLTDIDSVKNELNDIIASMKSDEIALRVRRSLRGWTVRIGGASVDQVKAEQSAALTRIQKMVPDDGKLRAIVDGVTKQVEGMIAEGKAVERFRGKAILKTFYQRHVMPKNVGYAQMCLHLAKLIGSRGTLTQRLDPIFDKLIS